MTTILIAVLIAVAGIAGGQGASATDSGSGGIVTPGSISGGGPGAPAQGSISGGGPG
jgi:hypothetical protein